MLSLFTWVIFLVLPLFVGYFVVVHWLTGTFISVGPQLMCFVTQAYAIKPMVQNTLTWTKILE